MRILAIILYYGLARFIPAYPKAIGDFGKSLRAFCASYLFDSIGENINIRPNVRFGKGINISLGNNSGIGEYTYIVAMDKVLIGQNVMMGPECMLLTGNHGYDDVNKTLIEQSILVDEIIIEDDVWIGARVILLPGAKIKKRTIVAAGSVVSGEIGPNGIYGGVPAKLIKEIL